LLATIPAMIRLVDVPISVAAPPRIDAKLTGRYSLDGGSPVARETSRTTGTIIATSGVLFRKALETPTKGSILDNACPSDLGAPMS